MTATYWEIGRRIVESEQGGEKRAGYGEALLKRLAEDLTARLGRGFSERNLEQMRLFYSFWPISQTLSAKSEERGRLQTVQTASTQFDRTEVAHRFPLSWSHYVKLLAVRDAKAREFYETEALRGGWTVRQLDRQIGSQFYISAHCCRATKPPCSPKALSRARKTPSRPRKKSKTRWYWSFLT
jgi:hypothetical protein